MNNSPTQPLPRSQGQGSTKTSPCWRPEGSFCMLAGIQVQTNSSPSAQTYPSSRRANVLDLNVNAADWLGICTGLLGVARSLCQWTRLCLCWQRPAVTPGDRGIWNHIFWLIKAILSVLLPVSVNLFSRSFLNGALQEGRAWILLGAGGGPDASSRQVYSWALATFEWHFHLFGLPHKAHSAQFAHEPRRLFHLASEVGGGLFPLHSKQLPTNKHKLTDLSGGLPNLDVKTC